MQPRSRHAGVGKSVKGGQMTVPRCSQQGFAEQGSCSEKVHSIRLHCKGHEQLQVKHVVIAFSTLFNSGEQLRALNHY